ncbi:MAG: AAA family ATPase [Chloroflexi bacterium]|nr:AAA family ATPase [Chloroflexota bacterium]
MPVISIANQKGGVGKTTSTINLGAALQEAGKRVLLIDLDPQGNLTIAAGLQSIDDVFPTVGDLLLSGAVRGNPGAKLGLKDAIVQTPSGLAVVPSNAKLSAAELALVSAMSREHVLRALLEQVQNEYDFVLIDCLPSLGLIVINALTASDGIVIPVQADFLAMQGLAQILETLTAVQERLNPALEVYGILMTLVDQRTAHSRDVVAAVRDGFQGKMRVFDTEIRLHVVLKESVKAGTSILDFDSGSMSAQAYRALAREVLEVASESSGTGGAIATDVALPRPTPQARVMPEVSDAPPPVQPVQFEQLEETAVPANEAAPLEPMPVPAAPMASMSAEPAVASGTGVATVITAEPTAGTEASVAVAKSDELVPPVSAPAMPPPLEEAPPLPIAGQQPPPPPAARFIDFVAGRMSWLGSDAAESR